MIHFLNIATNAALCGAPAMALDDSWMALDDSWVTLGPGNVTCPRCLLLMAGSAEQIASVIRSFCPPVGKPPCSCGGRDGYHFESCRERPSLEMQGSRIARLPPDAEARIAATVKPRREPVVVLADLDLWE